MMQLLFRPVLLMAILSMILGVSARQTVEGFGKDLKTLGDSIEKKANKSDSSSD